MWASQQPSVPIDPGQRPDDLPLRERVLYEAVQATGGHAVSWGYGPTPEQIIDRVRDVLDTMQQYNEHGQHLQDFQRAGSDHWRLSVVVNAAADLERRQLLVIDPSPHIAERLRPTHEGCAKVREWQHTWAERNKSWYAKTGGYIKGFLDQNVLISLCALLLAVVTLISAFYIGGKNPLDLLQHHTAVTPTAVHVTTVVPRGASSHH